MYMYIFKQSVLHLTPVSIMDKQTQERHEKKLSAIVVTCHVHYSDPHGVIFNISNHVLTVTKIFLLLFGLDFYLSMNKLNFYSQFLLFESLAKRLTRGYTSEVHLTPRQKFTFSFLH